MGMKPRGGGTKTIDGYVSSLSGWQADAVQALRAIVRDAVPSISESIKWAQPVFEENGPVCYLKAFKSHVNLGFWRGAELTDPAGKLQGTGGKMRHLRIGSMDDIDGAALEPLIREAARLNLERGNPAR